ncbi:MAG: PAS domain S-box protein [Agriterribacter sp.]
MSDFFIAGIGASSGGLQALQAFFEATPADSGIAYVVILHLSPNYDSELAQVLQRATAMPVTQVTTRTRLQANHVYVIAPDKHLTMEDDYIVVSPNIDLAERRAPVDIFFRSLAELHKSRAIAIVLSGSGANGSMGLKRIKERGGAVFVQNPREAEFNEMPRNAIATELVDEVLNVADIPARLIAYRHSLGTIHIPEAAKNREDNDQKALRVVLTELRLRTGHDFVNYKRPTLLRRIERRIHVRGLPDLPAYAAFISQHPEETHSLLKDLLISVTNFFRDKTPFEVLEKTVLPELLKAKTGGDHLRVWVAGCATGEEAYSIAMICAELTVGMVDAPKIQIFATDIDEAAIAAAREGFYTLNDAADIPHEWLARYFTQEEAGYRVRRELRETILFAQHNFIKDSPFSRIDLVSCRNVLIYLNRAAQERVFETFHFALKAGGFLLLGASESVEGASELFSIYNREQHIWRARQVETKNILVPEHVPHMELPQLPVKTSLRPLPQERTSTGELHQQLVELYAPPSIIVNEEYDILHISERAGKYLRFAGGEPTQNLIKVIHDELRSELRSVLYQATQHKMQASALDLKVRLDDYTENLNIHVRPAPDSTNGALQGLILVIFEPAKAAVKQVDVATTIQDEPVIRQLEEQVIRLKAQLTASNEQHQFAAEELKAGNEELQAMNEELRSATEELETSKEELQSTNEELSTVNQELKVKVEESSITSNNLRNIINSTDIGILILDRSFRVVLFTPAARSIFNLIPADYGRSLSDITNRLREDNLVADAEQVLQTLHSREHELETTDNRTYLTRLGPYRTDDDRIQGVVISFLDITERKRTESALREAEERYRIRLEEEVQQRTVELADSKNLLQATMDSSMDMIQVFQAVRNEQNEIVDFVWVLNNHSSEKIYGNVLGKSLLTLNPGVVETGIFDTFKKVVETGIPDQTERHYVKEQFNGWFFQSTVKLGDGVATTTSDITSRKKAELDLLQGKNLLQDIIDAPAIGITAYKAVRNKQGKIIDFVHEYVNRASLHMLGGEDFTGKMFSDHGENALLQMPRFTEVIEGGKSNSYIRETDFHGRKVWFAITNTPLSNDRLVHTWEDISERKRTEAEILSLKDEIARKATDKYRNLFNSVDDGFAIIELIYNEEGKLVDFLYLETNPAFVTQVGMDMQGKRRSELALDNKDFVLQQYEQLIQTGEPVHFEYFVSKLGDQWFQVTASLVGGAGSDLAGVVFRNITERKKAEEFQAYLIRLSDTLREVTDAVEIQAVAATMLGEQLRCDRAYYVEVDQASREIVVTRDWHHPRSPSHAGRYPLAEWPMPWLVNGKTLVVRDANIDPALSDEQRESSLGNDIGAAVVVPLIKQSVLVAMLVVNQRLPRNWTQKEISLVEETAEHTWAVVERAKAEEALRESESRFRRLFTNNMVPMFVWTPEGDILDTNDAFLELIGYTRQEFEATGSRWDALTPPEGHARDLQAVAEVLDKGICEPYEKQFRHKDGHWVPFLVGAGVFDHNHFSGVCYAIDLTERKRAEEALRTTEQRLRAVFQQAPLAIAITGPVGEILFRNTVFDQLWGRPAHDTSARTYSDVYEGYHMDGRPVASEEWPGAQAVLEGKITEGTVLQIVQLNGQRIPCSFYAAPIRDSVGNIAGGVVMFRDVSSEWQAQEALRKSEDRLQKAISIETVGVLFFSLEGKITDANEAAARMFGYNRQELLDITNWEELTDVEFLGVTKQAAANLATRGETPPYEKGMVRKDGSHWWGLFAATRLRGEGRNAECVEFIIDITETKRAAESLHESETRLRTLSDAVPQIIWTNNAEGAANYFNKRWYEYTGLSYEQSHGPGWEVAVHPHDAPASKKRWQQAFSTGTTFDTEYRLRGRDSRYRWFICRNVPLHDASGKITGWFGSATDIHDLKLAEEALHESRERLRVTMESAVDYAIITTNVDGDIEGWSYGAKRIFGYDEAEVLGQSANLIFTPEDRAAKVPQKEMEKARLEGRAEDERWHLRRDGSRFYMSGVTTPIYDGQLTGYVKVARDMTGQKAAEEQLRVSEERYRTALESAEMAAWDWNVTADMVMWNDQHYRILGLVPDGQQKKAGFFMQFVHPDDLAAVSLELTKAVEEEHVYKAEFRIIRADNGQTRWMSGYGQALARENGRATRMVGVMFDITERKVLEQQKEQFIGIASHELRTPVTSIKAYTEVLEELFTESGDMRSADLMRKMDVQVDRLTSLIYALLDTTRIAGGKLVLQKSDFAIDELLIETTEPMQRIAGKQQIELLLGASPIIHADRERIRQVLINLLSNAIKYASGTGNILVQSNVQDNELIISVKDNGAGIEEAEQQKIFEQFFRSNGANNVSGLGLGLFISSTIIKEHGGRIWVKSRKGEGAQFFFTIPLAKE